MPRIFAFEYLWSIRRFNGEYKLFLIIFLEVERRLWTHLKRQRSYFWMCVWWISLFIVFLMVKCSTPGNFMQYHSVTIAIKPFRILTANKKQISCLRAWSIWQKIALCAFIQIRNSKPNAIRIWKWAGRRQIQLNRLKPFKLTEESSTSEQYCHKRDDFH